MESIGNILSFGGLLCLPLSGICFLVSIVFGILSQTKKAIWILLAYPVFVLVLLIFWTLRIGGASSWETIAVGSVLFAGQILYVSRFACHENKCLKITICSSVATIAFLLLANILVNIAPLLGSHS